MRACLFSRVVGLFYTPKEQFGALKVFNNRPIPCSKNSRFETMLSAKPFLWIMRIKKAFSYRWLGTASLWNRGLGPEMAYSERFVETQVSRGLRFEQQIAVKSVNARELFNWLKPVLKPVNCVSTSKILEVSKKHAQWQSWVACCRGFSWGINKPTMRHTSRANDFVYAKSHAREKLPLTGYTQLISTTMLLVALSLAFLEPMGLGDLTFVVMTCGAAVMLLFRFEYKTSIICHNVNTQNVKIAWRDRPHIWLSFTLVWNLWIP